LSIPRARDVHKNPVPRIGGVAIVISFVIVLAIYLIKNHSLFQLGNGHLFGVDRGIYGILVGGLIIGLAMLFDDIYGIGAKKKLAMQILVALIVIASGIGIDHLSNPFGPAINLNSIYIPLFHWHGVLYQFSLLSDILTLVWLVGMMNVINFIDGVDGLAAGQSFIAAFVIFMLSRTIGQSGVAMISIILAGSSLGFLFFNFPPAKIFMGDSGSMFLGFVLGVLPLLSGGKLATVFLVLGFPIIDGLIVAGSRLLRGQNPMTTPDKTHLHHRFLNAGFTTRQAIFSLYIISIAFGWVALRSSTESKIIASIILVICVFLLILILNKIATKKL
jgi:UDP-GlcNAc:undecaprenyl-phosphate GlcNAc-1-phosphate transferase